MNWKTCACFCRSRISWCSGVSTAPRPTRAGSSWIWSSRCAAPADTPVLTDTYDGVQVQLEGTQATITLSPAPKTDQWGDIGIRVEQDAHLPHPWRL